MSSGTIVNTYVRQPGRVARLIAMTRPIAQNQPLWSDLQWDYDHPDIPTGDSELRPAHAEYLSELVGIQ
jgi:hypothetical protein